MNRRRRATVIDVPEREKRPKRRRSFLERVAEAINELAVRSLQAERSKPDKAA